MKFHVFSLVIAIALCLGQSANAVTVGYWTFEDGQAGQPMNPGSNGQVGTLDLSGNNYHLHAWNDYAGAWFSQYGQTPTGTGLSAAFSGTQDLYTTASGIAVWAPNAWTVEAAVMLTDLGGWQTFVGRDSAAPGGGNASAFYFQKTPDNYFRIRFVTADGQTHMATSSFPMQAHKWYRIAAVSDGTTLSLYVDRLEGNGYELAASAQMDPGQNNAMAPLNAKWTIGRGWWNGNYVDRITGFMDDVRFTDAALAPGQFLYPDNEVAVNPPPIAPQPGYRWEIVFEDDFQDPQLDTSKWGYNYPWSTYHNHRANMRPEQVTVEDGKLVITAVAERSIWDPWGIWRDEFGWLDLDYTSGAVHTNGSFWFKHGYVEGSFKVPWQQSTWPAFWMLQDGWPPEIDIFELAGDRTRWYTAYHYGPDWQNAWSYGQWNYGPQLHQNFHTYGMHWTSSRIDWYMDGQHSYGFHDPSALGYADHMYLIINLAVGGWAPDPDPQGYPAVMECDWIRVWQQVPVN